MKMIIVGSGTPLGLALADALIRRDVETLCPDRANQLPISSYFATADQSDIDCVFYLARGSTYFPAVCDACCHHNVKLVFTSSLTEDDRLKEQYARDYNKSASCVRIMDVYGPEPRKGTLLWQLLNYEHIELSNEGKTLRHYTYISDVVEALIYAYGCGRELVSAINPERYTEMQLAECVRDFKPLEINAVRERWPCGTRQSAFSDAIYNVPLHYKPLTEGIKRIFEKYGQTITK